MNKRRQKKVSKFLSYILRHHPQSIDIKLDKGGWADIRELLSKTRQGGFKLTRDELERIVEENNKQRFSLSEDGFKIRANYGHSIEVDLGYKPVAPPELLYHGTAVENLKSIRANGLTKGSRQYVHLSPDPQTAVSVGRRHGKPVVLKIKSKQMHSTGYTFFLSESGIWLTKYVPTEFLVIPELT